MQTISWWEAWSLWFSGQEVPGNLYMGPFTILAWGRIGKIISFVGGLTILLDLVGPKRLREASAIPLGLLDTLFEERLIAITKSRMIRNSAGTIVMNVLSLAIGLAYAVAYVTTEPTSTSLLSTIVFTIGTFLLASLIAYIVLFLAGVLTLFTLLGAAFFLDDNSPALAFRYIGVSFLLGGFHLDLLAS